MRPTNEAVEVNTAHAHLVYVETKVNAGAFVYAFGPDGDSIVQAATDEYSYPEALVAAYVSAGVRRALVEETVEGTVFASIPVFPGVWAEAETEEATMAELQDVARQWVDMKIEDRDRDLPILGTIDLNWL